MLALDRETTGEGFQRALDHIVYGRPLIVGIREQVSRMGQCVQPGYQCLACVVEFRPLAMLRSAIAWITESKFLVRCCSSRASRARRASVSFRSVMSTKQLIAP